MLRYFIEVSYKGTCYAGFQVQQNAVTIQSEVEKALEIFYKNKFTLTGASRTDSGVHALQNFFHLDIEQENLLQQKHVYNLNAILPADIVLKNIFQVNENAHCRFDALKRSYDYFIYSDKDPFIADKAYFFPYKLNIDLLNEAAGILKTFTDFTSFSKRNTQVNNFFCSIEESYWDIQNNMLVYHVTANRFLRGMVRGLTATMLRVGTSAKSIADFKNIIEAKNCSNADFSAPAHGLFLKQVTYPKDLFEH
ncbi:tRNA pseudouridine(38-40) synthase TruA [soil metagenome]